MQGTKEIDPWNWVPMKETQSLNVSSKHQRQISRASGRKSNRLWNDYILRSLRDDDDAFAHLFSRKDGNFSHDEMENLFAEAERIARVTGRDEFEILAEFTELFTNPLKLAEYDNSKRIPGKHSGYTPPSERVTNGGWIVLTYEYDGTSKDDLETQLDWFAGKPEDCAFHEAHRALSAFPDYRGYSAVFSGSKSVHIHTIWDTRHLFKELAKRAPVSVQKLWRGDVSDGDLAGLHWVVWPEVAEIINKSLGASIQFDLALRSYTQKRRSPFGTRTFTKTDPLHGFKAGDQTTQTVMQEHVANKTLAPKGSAPMFSFAKSANASKLRRHGHNKVSDRKFVLPQETEILKRLQQYLLDNAWGVYPKPVRIDFDGSHNFIFFLNDPSDTHPSTFVRSDYRKLYLAGRGAADGDVFLPNELTLDETLTLLFPSNSGHMEASPNARRPKWPVGLERFRQKATDYATARDEASRILQNVGTREGVTLIQTHEGLGKTHGLFSRLLEHRWDADTERYQNREAAIARGEDVSNFSFVRGPTIVACGSYEQLLDKQQEFRQIEQSTADAVTIKSVSQLYAEALENCSVKQIHTKEDAGKAGYPHLLAAIQQVQPDVYAEMKRLRDAAWQNTNGVVQFRHDAVIFMVHSLLKVWPHAIFSRAFLHPDFPDKFDINTAREYAEQLNPFRVIFDEIRWEDLAAVVPEKDRDLANSIRKACQKLSEKDWDEATLAERVAAYSQSLTDELSFDDADALIRLKLNKKHRYQVDTNSYPFGKGTVDKNFYAQAHGETYYCRPYRWFNSLGCPVVILTTEDLPTLVGRAIAKTSQSTGKFRIIRLTDTPHIHPDRVQLVFDERARMPRQVRADGTPVQSVIDLTKELLSSGYDFVISDGLGNIGKPYEDQVASHVSARGRNDLKGKKIASIVTYPSLEQYKRLCILAKAVGIPTPVSIGMRDQVYQNFGRNLGFRREDNQQSDLHTVIIKASLFKELHHLSGQMDANLSPDRYECILIPR